MISVNFNTNDGQLADAKDKVDTLLVYYCNLILLIYNYLIICSNVLKWFNSLVVERTHGKKHIYNI